MAQSNIVGMPNPGQTKVLTLAANDATLTRGLVRRGVMYMVTATVDCWMNYEVAAVANTGIYIPAKVPMYFMFGSADSQGVDIEIHAIAGGAGYLHFTPITPVFGLH